MDLDAEAACAVSHPLIEAAQGQVNMWITQAHEALRAGSAMRFTVPHPDGNGPALELRGLDPTTGHVVVELARIGAEAITALYVGLFCQETTGGWQGVAGAYVPMCVRCALGDPEAAELSRDVRLQVAVRAAARVTGPEGSRDLSLDEVPENLTPRGGWFDRRGLRVIRLPAAVGEAWRVVNLAELAARTTGAALVCTGPALTSEPNVLFIENAHDLREVLPLLAVGKEPPLAAVRQGSADELRQLGTEPSAAIQPAVRFEFRTARSRVPAGWGLLQKTSSPGRVELTRAATTAVRDQLSGRAADATERFIFWAAPRLSAGGAIDITALLHRRNELHPNTETEPTIRRRK